MARRIFYSFHYQPDHWRAQQIRNMGVIEGNAPVSPNAWEDVKKGGDAAISRWIDDQLSGRSCTVVLIGSDTADRPWINYEIKQSWQGGKGLLGIHIHNLKDSGQQRSTKGANPFAGFTIDHGKTKLSSVVKVYDPPSTDSTLAYGYIKDRLVDWIEDAISIRNDY